MSLSKKTKRFLLGTGIVIGLMIAVPLIMALFVSTEFSVERDVIIERPVDEVFEYIRYLSNQEHYSVWSDLDPEMYQEYRGEDGTVGFVSAWEGNDDVGSGEQEITEISEGERIDFKLRFYEPFESEADVYMITEPTEENHTRVIWGFESSMPYPMNLILLFMDIDRQIGEDYQTGLLNLKDLLEADAQATE